MSGLEALGVAASIIQVAEIGFQLSKNIYNYVDTASSADDRLARIARNVDLTTEVVRRVADVFESESEPGSTTTKKKKKKVVNQEALRLGREVAGECEVVFGRLMGEVGRLMENPRRYYKFPFKESKFVLWEAQLEKLKTTLNCLMNVLILAQALKENKDPSHWGETIERLADERDEATLKYERLRKELEGASSDNAASSSAITHIRTTVPPPRYDQIEGSKAPDEAKETTPPMRYLEDCIPRVQAMLDTINDMQRTLGQQSRDYVKETEIRNLWSVYWSMNDKMTDTLRKLESEHKGPKLVQFSKEHSDLKTETETYTETITWTRPTAETQKYHSLDTHLSFKPEDRTTSSEERLAEQRKLGCSGESRLQRLQSAEPAQLVPETRSWEPPLVYTEETQVVETTPLSMPVGMAPEERVSESAEAEERPKLKKKDGVVEELLREWTTVYD